MESVKIEPQQLELNNENCWNMFDSIVCIRPTNQQKSEPMIEKYNIPVKYFEANTNSRQDRFCAHVNAMRSLLQDENLTNAFIFEDEVSMINVPTLGMIDEVRKFFETNTDWDLFYLSVYPSIFNHVATKMPGFHNVYRLQSNVSNAYVVSRKFMQRLIHVDYDLLQASIDNIYAINTQSYAVLPTWFYAMPSFAADIPQSPFVKKMTRTLVNCNNVMASSLSALSVVAIIFALCVLVFLWSLFVFTNKKERF